MTWNLLWMLESLDFNHSISLDFNHSALHFTLHGTILNSSSVTTEVKWLCNEFNSEFRIHHIWTKKW